MRVGNMPAIGLALTLVTASVVTTVLPRDVMAHGVNFAAGSPGDPKKPARVIEIIAREGDGRMSYTPDAIDVKRGEQIRFVIKNEGVLAHEFLLDSFEGNAKHKIQMEKNPEMEHDEPNGVRLEPKKDGGVLWIFDKVGKFEFACLIPGHYEGGMKGVITVADAKPATKKK